MCGLFGFINCESGKLNPEEIEAGRNALTTISHRGPDQWSEAIEGGLYMGHRRLSILDLSEAGRQPMETAHALLTINGEIYNYQDIKKNLDPSLFQSGSDSEVVLHGYPALSMDTLIERMDGMYAIVLWDKKENHLHLVRDRTGIKPLLYAHIGNYFIWASELKAIKSFCAAMHLPLHEDNTALFDFLTYRYIPAEKTLYKEVKNLKPAHALHFDLERSKTRQYWSLSVSDEPVDHDLAAEQLRALIEESVAEQLMGDVPVGFFLSGGMDSSILVAHGAKLHKAPATFSIGYQDAREKNDETPFAQIIADHFGTDHHVEHLNSADADNIYERILRWYDQPFGDNSALPTYHVSRFARQHATVALSGDGGDELFGGYRWYDRFAKFSGLQLPLPATNFAQKTRGLMQKFTSRLDLMTQRDPLALYALLIDGLPPAYTKRYREALEVPADYDALWLFRAHDNPNSSLKKRLQYIDFYTFLPDDILTKVDRVSMDVSLEARVPYLSRKICEFAFSLPEDFLYRNGELKGGLKYAYKDILPPTILQRDKKGFSIPMVDWNMGEQKFQEKLYLHTQKP